MAEYTVQHYRNTKLLCLFTKGGKVLFCAEKRVNFAVISGIVTVVAKQNGWYLCSGTTTEGKVAFGWSSGGYLQQLVGNVLKGDVNGDTLVNAVDALYILQAAVGKRTFTPEEKQYLSNRLATLATKIK